MPYNLARPRHLILKEKPLTRKLMLRRTVGTVLLIVTLGLTNCQAVLGTLVGGGSAIASTAGMIAHG